MLYRLLVVSIMYNSFNYYDNSFQWTSLLCALLAVSVSVGQQCCNDEIPTDRCDPASREEIDSSGLQEGDVLSSPCTDISEE